MKNCKEEGEESTAGAATDEAAAIAEEGNRGPAMEVRLCGGHVSFGHDHGGPAMEVLWWSGEKRENVRRNIDLVDIPSVDYLTVV
ncbi:hypothetical protein ACB092_11G099700 [Castanea dentata]